MLLDFLSNINYLTLSISKFINFENFSNFSSKDLWGSTDPSTSSAVGFSPIGNICTSNRYSIAEGIFTFYKLYFGFIN